MSALPPIADIGTQSRNVRFVPKADIPPKHHSLVYGHRPVVGAREGLSLWTNETVVFALNGESERFKHNKGVLKMAKITSVKELVKELANFDLNVTEEKMTEVIKEALRVYPESAELAWSYIGELLGYERLQRH